MKFIVTVLAAFASLALAQDDTASPSASLVSASVAPAQPSAPAAPAAPNSSNGISIISPTGTRAYKSGEKMVVTWNILGSDPEYQFTDVQFQICDASGGANKVSPIGAYLTNATSTPSVGLLSITADVPANIPPGNAYTVRAEIRGATGFIYFFSPNFPINKDLVASAAPSAAASAAAPAATTGNAVASAAPVPTSKSGAVSQVLGALAVLPVMLWL
ncbi:hypothetical protein CcCBS67573_g05010 [Chytriomyces confervae]|uniref:Uncharacterized protein n=1 Tax=Chytriomyces confervae TaxID=246404 RepID=A0A507FDQ9_9FUNG|nr:hypothetical protein HDU80_011213 [Chytriomyces hyalinus]TPX73720.1 hypothetical protein CcCBS67573_g05010 [Chytriomyces confervae]